MVVMARSVPLTSRVMIKVAAHASADTSGKTAAGWKALEPGRRMIRTPARPTAVASQRRRPTRSPRKKIDNAVTNNGETKPVADASAIGRKRRPEMKNSDEASNATPRIICKPGRRVCSAYSGEPGSIAGTMISANTRKRSQAISTDGSVAERYFAVASDVPRNTVESRINAMPRSGRSARAGAVRAAGLLSGKSDAALSSLAVAAGGGFTVELRCRKSNRAKPQKT